MCCLVDQAARLPVLISDPGAFAQQTTTGRILRLFQPFQAEMMASQERFAGSSGGYQSARTKGKTITVIAAEDEVMQAVVEEGGVSWPNTRPTRVSLCLNTV